MKPPEHPENAVEAQSGTARLADTNVYWSLELTNAVYPDAMAFGKIDGKDFLCERSSFAMQTGQLTLRTGRSGPVDFGVQIFFAAHQPQDLAGRKIRINTNDAVAPRILMKWKSGDQPITQTFTGGYSLRMEFATLTGNQLPGKIYLCLPDEPKSYVVGNFTAEIRRPPPPRPPGPVRR